MGLGLAHFFVHLSNRLGTCVPETSKGNAPEPNFYCSEYRSTGNPFATAPK